MVKPLFLKISLLKHLKYSNQILIEKFLFIGVFYLKFASYIINHTQLNKIISIIFNSK